MKDIFPLVCSEQYLTSEGVSFLVEIRRKKYMRTYLYRLYKNGEICANGICPKTFTPRDVFNYWVKDNGTVETFKVVE